MRQKCFIAPENLQTHVSFQQSITNMWWWLWRWFFSSSLASNLWSGQLLSLQSIDICGSFWGNWKYFYYESLYELVLHFHFIAFICQFSLLGLMFLLFIYNFVVLYAYQIQHKYSTFNLKSVVSLCFKYMPKVSAILLSICYQKIKRKETTDFDLSDVLHLSGDFLSSASRQTNLFSPSAVYSCLPIRLCFPTANGSKSC